MPERPAIEVAGDPERLRMTIDRGPQMLTEADAYSFSEGFLTIDLTSVEAAIPPVRTR